MYAFSLLILLFADAAYKCRLHRIVLYMPWSTRAPSGGATYLSVLLLPGVSDDAADVERECRDAFPGRQLM